MAPKVREIARSLSLSPGTVSKALRGSPGQVSLKTAEMVLNYCHSNGYMSKAEASRILFKMTSQTSGKQIFTLTCRRGLLMYDAVLAGICEQLQNNDLFTSSFMVNASDAMNRFPYDRAGAVIIMGRIAAEVLDHFTEASIPVVLVDNRIAESSTSAVNSNNLEATSRAVEILVAAGHERIAFICNHEDQRSLTYTFHQRQAGFLAGLASQGLPIKEELLVLQHAPDYDSEEFDWDQCIKDLRKLANRVLELKPLPTAVVAVNDMHACVLRDVLQERGLSVPEDISVIGYDGQHRLSAVNHAGYAPVSSMVVPWHEMGAEAVDLALDLMCDAEQKPKFLEVPTSYEDAGTVFDRTT